MSKLAPPQQRADLDPDRVLMSCELCGYIQPKGQMHSLTASYVMPGGTTPGYHCAAIQHFGCNHEHAMLALLCCLFEHLDEGPHEEHGNPYTHPLLARLKADLAELVIEEEQESGDLVPDREA